MGWNLVETEKIEKNPLVELLLERSYKAMNPTDILHEIFDLIEAKEHYGMWRSWDILVELLGDHLGLTRTGYVSLKRYVEEKGLIKRYLKAAQHDRWDHIGELFNELELPTKDVFLTPRSVVQLMVLMNMMEEPTQICRVLDPCVGTGRFLLSATNLYPDAPLLLYGIDINLSVYRACLVNMKIFSNHFYYILCGDALRLPPEASSPMWRLANRWEPADLSLFYGKYPRPSKGFDLKEFVKEMKAEKEMQ